MSTTEADSLTLADMAHLEWARKLGRRGWGHVHPNPLVGCVMVKDDRTVAEGYHGVFGGPHAEIVALEEAKSRVFKAQFAARERGFPLTFTIEPE